MITASLPGSAARLRGWASIATAWGVWVVIALLVFGATARAAAAERTILFFGDSLTAGYGLDDPQADSYPADVRKKIEAAHLPWRVVNAGLSGETTAGGLRRIDWVLRQHVDIVVLALGGNDGLRGIDPATTQRNLEGIIDRIRAKYPTAKVVVAGMQMPPSMGEDYVREYQAVFPRVAQEKRAILLPFLLEGVAGRPDLNQPDGIHPTAAGATIVAETVWKTIKPLL